MPIRRQEVDAQLVYIEREDAESLNRIQKHERAVLMRVGRTQVLLGVAPGQVSPLHVLAEPFEAPAPQSTPAAAVSFQALLRRSLGR